MSAKQRLFALRTTLGGSHLSLSKLSGLRVCPLCIIDLPSPLTGKLGDGNRVFTSVTPGHSGFSINTRQLIGWNDPKVLMNRNTVYFIRSLIAPNGHIEVLKKKDTNSYLSPGERKIKKVLEEFSDGKET